MNKCILGGFISSDIKIDDIKLKDGNTMKKARFSIACQKKSRNGGANFIQVVALGEMANTLSKWFSKGRGIYVECEINTNSYTNKEGRKVYTEEKVITSWEFPPVRKSEEMESTPVNEATQPVDNSTHTSDSQTPPPAPDDNFMDIDDSVLDELPFK